MAMKYSGLWRFIIVPLLRYFNLLSKYQLRIHIISDSQGTEPYKSECKITELCIRKGKEMGKCKRFVGKGSGLLSYIKR